MISLANDLIPKDRSGRLIEAAYCSPPLFSVSHLYLIGEMRGRGEGGEAA